ERVLHAGDGVHRVLEHRPRAGAARGGAVDEELHVTDRRAGDGELPLVVRLRGELRAVDADGDAGDRQVGVVEDDAGDRGLRRIAGDAAIRDEARRAVDARDLGVEDVGAGVAGRAGGDGAAVAVGGDGDRLLAAEATVAGFGDEGDRDAADTI